MGERKKASMLEMRKRFDADRRHQLETVQSARLAKQQADKEESHAMLLAAKHAKKQADEIEDERRRKERAAAMMMAEEAQHAKVRKEKQRHEEHQNDILRAKAHQELLDEQERKRAEGIAKVKEKQSKLLAQFEAGVGNELERRQREDDERAKRHQKVLEEKEHKISQAKEK